MQILHNKNLTWNNEYGINLFPKSNKQHNFLKIESIYYTLLRNKIISKLDKIQIQ